MRYLELKTNTGGTGAVGNCRKCKMNELSCLGISQRKCQKGFLKNPKELSEIIKYSKQDLKKETLEKKNPKERDRISRRFVKGILINTTKKY